MSHILPCGFVDQFQIAAPENPLFKTLGKSLLPALRIMSQVTEVVFIPVAEGEHPEDPASSLKPAFDKMLQTIVSQPGAQRLHWGRQIENPTIATLFIDWNSLADHQKFIDSE